MAAAKQLLMDFASNRAGRSSAMLLKVALAGCEEIASGHIEEIEIVDARMRVRRGRPRPQGIELLR
jgi:hypothetical protein